MNILNQNKITTKDLEKHVFLDKNDISNIKNIIIQTNNYIDPSTDSEMTQIVTFIAKVFTEALLNSQKNGEEKFSVDIYLAEIKVKDINYEYMKYLAEIMKQLFPERLSCARLIDPPRYFISAYEIIKKFIDPPTRKKIIIHRTKNSG